MSKPEPANIKDERGYRPAVSPANQLAVGTWFTYPDSSKLFLKLSSLTAWNFRSNELCDLPVATVVPVETEITILRDSRISP